MWLCLAGSEPSQTIPLYKFVNAKGSGIQISLDVNMRTFLVDLIGLNKPLCINNSKPIKLDQWYHFAFNMNYSGRRLMIYVNSELVGKLDDYTITTDSADHDHQLVFSYPPNTKLQDLRLYNSASGAVDPICHDSVRSVYNGGKGTYNRNDTSACVGHFCFNDGGRFVTNQQHVSSIVPTEIRVPDSWIAGGHIPKQTSNINFNVLPKVVFPCSAYSIHTYFSVVVPDALSTMSISMDLITSAEILHESQWELAYVFEGRDTSLELGNLATFTIVSQVDTKRTPLISHIQVPHLDTYSILQGRLTRKSSDFATVLHGIQLYN